MSKELNGNIGDGINWLSTPIPMNEEMPDVLYVDFRIQKVRDIFLLVLGIGGWISLIIMLWGILLDWFPGSSWPEHIAAGLLFLLAGLVGISQK